MISRERIFLYVKKKYSVDPDYPLPMEYFEKRENSYNCSCSLRNGRS